MDRVDLAPAGDEEAVRWVAVRHADDHIHIVATLARADGCGRRCGTTGTGSRMRTGGGGAVRAPVDGSGRPDRCPPTSPWGDREDRTARMGGEAPDRIAPPRHHRAGGPERGRGPDLVRRDELAADLPCPNCGTGGRPVRALIHHPRTTIRYPDATCPPGRYEPYCRRPSAKLRTGPGLRTTSSTTSTGRGSWSADASASTPLASTGYAVTLPGHTGTDGRPHWYKAGASPTTCPGYGSTTGGTPRPRGANGSRHHRRTPRLLLGQRVQPCGATSDI
jgi:hypothetical protein